MTPYISVVYLSSFTGNALQHPIDQILVQSATLVQPATHTDAGELPNELPSSYYQDPEVISPSESYTATYCRPSYDTIVLVTGGVRKNIGGVKSSIWMVLLNIV